MGDPDDRGMPPGLYRRLDESLGPRNASARPELKASIEAASGYALTDQEWTYLTFWARKAGNLFVFRSPVSPESRDRVDSLRVAAHALRIALVPVQSILEQEQYAPGRTPAEISLLDEIADRIDASERLPSSADHDDFFPLMIWYADQIEQAAKTVLAEIAPTPRGAGAKIHGYDAFLKCCRAVWANRNEDRGFSKRRGAYRGEFVSLVFAAQCLLPSAMQRPTEAAVGAAIDLWFRNGGKSEFG